MVIWVHNFEMIRLQDFFCHLFKASNFLMKGRLFLVLEISSGLIRVANSFGWDENAIYNFGDGQSSFSINQSRYSRS